MYKIPIAKPFFGNEEIENLTTCVQSTWVSSAGKFIDEFEKNFAHYCGTKYAISTSNGTTALHLAVMALGIGPGDEVLVPSLTFVSCANVIVYVGAKPVFVDIDRASWTIDPDEIEKHISRRSKAILAVHLYGYPAEMDKIKKIAKRHNLFLIEDAAEAHGAEYEGKKVGGLGDIGCFSFYGNKIITTGEGGMVTLNNRKIFDKIVLQKNHGTTGKKRYWHSVVGYNYRMTNMQAALGVAQLRQIDRFLERRKEIDMLYRKLLLGIAGIILPPANTKKRKGVCWQFSMRIENKTFGMSRNQLITFLKRKSIETRPFFISLHKLPMYKMKNNFPHSDVISQEGISLPTSMHLSNKEIIYIVHSIKEAQRPKKT